jgi:Holliday junction resolvase
MRSTNRNAAAEARGVPESDQLGGTVNRENSLTTEPVQGHRGGRRSRAKGDRIEREIVSRHAAIGIKAERYPLSGASRFRGSGHDIDIYAFGMDEGPLVAEVKSRRSGAGFVTLEKWLGEYDCLFLRRNSAEPMVLLPWRVWAALLARERR